MEPDALKGSGESLHAAIHFQGRCHQVWSCEEGSSKMISEDRATDVWMEWSAASLCGLIWSQVLHESVDIEIPCLYVWPPEIVHVPGFPT